MRQPVIECIVARRRHVNGVNALVRQNFGHLQALFQTVALAGLADAIVHLIYRQAYHNGEIPPAGDANAVNDLRQKAHSVLQRTAVFVRSPVGIRRQELLNEIAMGGVQFHTVTAGFLYSLCRLYKLQDQPLHAPVGQTAVDALAHFAFFASAGCHGAWHNILILQLLTGRDYTAVQQLSLIHI